MFSFKPDYAQTHTRMEAFWNHDVLDRPLTMFHLSRPIEEQVPLPVSRFSSPAERWLDIDYQAQHALARLSNIDFSIGDALPITYPNLGPEIFSAFYGCPLYFGDYGTSWTDPILEDWARVDEMTLDLDHPYLRSLEEMTDALLDIGRDKFIVGMTDWHPGGDALAAFRDPQRLAIDLIEYPAEVKKLLARVEADYFQLYNRFYEKLHAAGQPCTSWLPLTADGKYYIPSNDFSIMISTRMYEEFFLPGITRECQHLDHSIYHLDGPGALRHLDLILAIPELDALQWVFGAGNEGYDRWVWVYQKAQAAGKSIHVICSLDEVERVMQTLSPRGLFLDVSGVPNYEAGEELLRRLERWTKEN
ncbi:MAG: hypothetical protein IH586_12845 [Anaerolineaceae bacterium]|nr:hypothetical protein [Anaerolineaceae bacterium]